MYDETCTELTLSCRGTPGWTAPELFSQNLLPAQKASIDVTATADVYAAGWVFYEVLCGVGPLIFQTAETDDDHAHSKRPNLQCCCAQLLDMSVKHDT